LIKIKPFTGLRPKAELYPKITSLPYDVLSIEDCREIVKNNEYSLIHITRSEVDLPDDNNPYSEFVYQTAKENLNKFIEKKYLIFDKKPCYYVYREIMGEHKQIGFVGVTSVSDYENGIIKKHENTRNDKEEDRIKHIDITNCQTEPVFLAYRNEKNLDSILNEIEKTKPEIDFISEDKIRQSLWIISDEIIMNNITESFSNIPYLYVADGHHRTAAAVKVAKKRSSDKKEKEEKDFNYFLSVIFPHNTLKILPYNRVVKDLNKNDLNSFIEKIKENFIINKVNSNDGAGFRPGKPKQIGMYTEGSWYIIEPKNEIINKDQVKSLDVSILQDYLLGPILGIIDPRTDKRIEFIGGIKGTEILKDKVDKKEFSVSFSMFPTSMEELLAVADSNKLMPPKSTWFEPKLRSGMVLHYLS
jgi:uncharacterized protein (DUF1015 family)